MNHVSVSPTNGNGTTQGQRKTLTSEAMEKLNFGLPKRNPERDMAACKFCDITKYPHHLLFVFNLFFVAEVGSTHGPSKIAKPTVFQVVLRGIGKSFQSAITAPRMNLTGYSNATAQS